MNGTLSTQFDDSNVQKANDSMSEWDDPHFKKHKKKRPDLSDLKNGTTSSSFNESLGKSMALSNRNSSLLIGKCRVDLYLFDVAERDSCSGERYFFVQ